MSVKIVTDSTADIPQHLIDKYGIIELPLTVHFGDEEYRDRIDITSEQFYEKLVSSNKLPSTSQVNPKAFEDVYKAELEKGNSVISIHISSDLSGTYQSAVIAKSALQDDKITVVDSRTATIALGMIALKAAELSESGMDHNDIVEFIEDYKNKVKLLIAVDTLEYLKRGGRLSGAQAVIGNILNIKPILTITDGKVAVVEKARGMKKAIKNIVEMIKEKGTAGKGRLIGIANAKCPDTADELKTSISQELGETKFIDTNVGSVIATHVGPGAFGVAYV
ncbi:DegV domain-containing protein [Oxobacter pfennigii]|uniref:DegV domain-containing protein n=1 Tax=Oxobacter pfennigii TaxID=36849 RepID=A0A0P8YZH5_9CLOT|nr:DegV family protein [Oxobacter pfennigii]KPU45267.1 DegV domain-containing protein [Oxobacter pfennigii]